jgi:hypothetical protein
MWVLKTWLEKICCVWSNLKFSFHMWLL